MDELKYDDSFVKEYFQESSFDMNDENLLRYKNLFSYYNRLVSESQVGDFKEEGLYEATLISKNYFENDLTFLIELFIKHSNGHYFHNGNKRTATQVFINFLKTLTPYSVKNINKLKKDQKSFVAKKINHVDFYEKIRNNIEIGKVDKNDGVKLENLIKRGEIKDVDNSHYKKDKISLNDLKQSDIFCKLLRKPYFQRDTNSWNVDRIEKLIDAFKNNMLIPSVILWSSQSDGLFIVDGAHRLSALIAWVNDDYGKNIDIKKHFQIKKYIDENVGSYDSFINMDQPSKVVQTLATKTINIEWIDGDYKLVKDSFIRINEQGVVISNDEKEIIKDDDKPVAQLSRNILSFSGGQSTLTKENKLKDVFDKLFSPKYDKLNKLYPMCGDLYDDFLISRIFKLAKVVDDKKNLSYEELVSRFNYIISMIIDELELNNRVYFYGMNSQYKQSALSGITKFIIDLIEQDKIDDFLSVRKDFENYLINNTEDIQQIVRKARHVDNSLEALDEYYKSLMITIETSSFDIISKKFTYLSKSKKSPRTTKIEENYKNEINALKKCTICGGYLNNYSKTEFHKICKERENIEK